MITRQDADEIAGSWAARESQRRGYECTPVVTEFDLGFVVWTMQPPDRRAVPGDGGRTVIDRETGLTTTWPAIPPDAVADLYREKRPGLVGRRRTVQPEAELRRNARRRVSPAVAAHLTVDGRMFITRGAKGDQTIDHHPLVVEFLRSTDPGLLVRGAERHAELIALSDVLHEVDTGRASVDSVPVTLDEVRTWLAATAQVEVFHIRETGDPLGGTLAIPCETCMEALVHFGVVDWGSLGWVAPVAPEFSDEIAQPGRFPEQAARIFAAGGWKPMENLEREVLADHAINDVVRDSASRGRRHQPFPAARQILYDFPVLMWRYRGRGERRRVRTVQLVPEKAMHTVDVLAEFAQVVGAALFPIGAEADDTLLVADERGRIFGLDQGGEWFLGETIDEALLGLVTGTGPAERIRDDGTW